MKLSKLVFVAAAAFVLALSAALAYLAYTFDARDYEPRLVEFVRDRTGRTLAIGDIELSFWPDLGIELGRVVLSERNSDQRFADVERARISVRLVPLLSRELAVREIHIRGAHLQLTRYEDGRLNIEDFFSRPGGDLKLDIERIEVDASSVSYQDRARARDYQISDIRLQTGRIAAASDAPVSLALHLSDSARTLDLNAALEARLAVDRQRRTYALHAVGAEVSGQASGLERLNARANGDFVWDAGAGEASVTRFSAVMKATLDAHTVEGGLQAARVVLGAQRASGERLVVQLRSAAPAGSVQVSIGVPRFVRTGDTLTFETLSLDSALDRGGYRIKATGVAAMIANLQQGVLTFDRFSATLQGAGGRLPPKGVSGEMSGEITIDARGENVRLNVGGNVADSRFKAQLAIAGWTAPAYTFAAQIDELDLDRYGGSDRKAGAAWDLSGFDKLRATGTLRIGLLKSANAKARGVTLMLKP